jgi:hypothetical protein
MSPTGGGGVDIDCPAGWPGSVCVVGGSPLEDWDWVEAVSGYLKAVAGSGVGVVALGVDAAEALEELGLGRFGVHQEVGEFRDGEVPIVRRADGGVVAVGRRVWRLTADAYCEYASTRRASQRTSCDRFHLLRSVKARPA